MCARSVSLRRWAGGALLGALIFAAYACAEIDFSQLNGGSMPHHHTLLIIGKKGVQRDRVINVARQIAEQHHAAQTSVKDAGDRGGMLKPAPGLGHKQLVILVKAPSAEHDIRAHRVINLDRFQRHPQGRAITFAIREAVDDCLAAG